MEENSRPSKFGHQQLLRHMSSLPESNFYAVQYKSKGYEEGPWKYLHERTNCGNFYVVRFGTLEALRRLLKTFSIKENRLARIVRVSHYLMDDQTEPSAFEVVHISQPRNRSDVGNMPKN